jgi:hypothetical protein
VGPPTADGGETPGYRVWPVSSVTPLMPPPELGPTSSSTASYGSFDPYAAEADDFEPHQELPAGGLPMPDAQGRPMPTHDDQAREIARQRAIVRDTVQDGLVFAEQVPGGVVEGAEGTVGEIGRLAVDLRERDAVAANNLSHYTNRLFGLGFPTELRPMPAPTSQTLQPLDTPQPSAFHDGNASKLEVLASRVPGVNLAFPVLHAMGAVADEDAGELGRITGRDFLFPLLLGGSAKVLSGPGGGAVAGLRAAAARVESGVAQVGERVGALADGLVPQPIAAGGPRPVPWQINESRAAGGGGGDGPRHVAWQKREVQASNENPSAQIKSKVLRTGWSTPEALGLIGLLSRQTGALTEHVVKFLKQNEYDLDTVHGQRAAIEAIERPHVQEILVEALEKEVADIDARRSHMTLLLEAAFPKVGGEPLARAVLKNGFDPRRLSVYVGADMREVRNTSLRDITRSDPVLARAREDVAVRARNAMENRARLSSDPVLSLMSPTAVERLAWRDKATDPIRFLPVEAELAGQRGAHHVSPEQRVAANESVKLRMGNQLQVFNDVIHVEHRLGEVKAQAQRYQQAGMDQLAEVTLEVHQELSAWVSAMKKFLDS